MAKDRTIFSQHIKHKQKTKLIAKLFLKCFFYDIFFFNAQRR